MKIKQREEEEEKNKRRIKEGKQVRNKEEEIDRVDFHFFVYFGANVLVSPKGVT